MKGGKNVTEKSFKGSMPILVKRAGKLIKEWLKDAVLVLTPPFQCLLAVLATAVFAVLPVVLVFSNFETLGILWLPILMVYTLFLSIVVRQVYRYQEMQAERFIYGDEMFFEAYPHFKKIEERKKRFKAWRKSLLPRKKEGNDAQKERVGPEL